MEQLNLFSTNRLEPIVSGENGGMSIDEAWASFHTANPHIGENLRAMALELKDRGFTQYGIKALWEVLCYQYAIQTEGKAFKLNNNYTALYARWLMATTPALDGFFEVRERRAGGNGS